MTELPANSSLNGRAPETSFEDSLAALEAAVHDLEDGQLGLGESLARYEQSITHLKHCYHLLEAAERKIELLTKVADDGIAVTEPFSETAATSPQSVGRKRRTRSPSRGEISGASVDDIDGSADAT